MMEMTMFWDRVNQALKAPQAGLDTLDQGATLGQQESKARKGSVEKLFVKLLDCLFLLVNDVQILFVRCPSIMLHHFMSMLCIMHENVLILLNYRFISSHFRALLVV